MGSAPMQGELWGKAAHPWAEIQEPLHTPLWMAMLDETNVGQATRFLDAGCGGGGASIIAANRGARVSGLDASAPLLRIAQERVPQGDFRVGDIQTLPFTDGSFDAVFAANSIQYSEDRLATLRELRRVCTAEGRIAAGLWSTPDKVDFRVIGEAVRKVLPEPPKGKGPYELSHPGILEGLFEQTGMQVVGSGEVYCPFDYPNFDTFWQAQLGAGPTQSVLLVIEESTLAEVLREAIEPFTAGDGTIHFNNYFRYVAAIP